MKNDLFVYGTLHPQRAPREIAGDVKRFKPVGEGTIRGEIRELADFPAVRRRRHSKDRVSGVVFEMPDDPALLARLDAYEDYQPNNLQASLFLRKKVMVTLADGRRRACWAYVYNQPLSA